ncbi:MAG: amidohydrolase, partial [Proteobacteria bacterium]|nr:amidohydrolase [Pseudomonadota bacterium]
MSLVISACGEEPSSEPAAAVADLVLLNGGIYTVDADRSWAQAAAVRDGLIVAVGSNEEIQALAGDSTRVIDLDGRMALPGFHDATVHPT